MAFFKKDKSDALRKEDVRKGAEEEQYRQKIKIRLKLLDAELRLMERSMLRENR